MNFILKRGMIIVFIGFSFRLENKPNKSTESLENMCFEFSNNYCFQKGNTFYENKNHQKQSSWTTFLLKNDPKRGKSVLNRNQSLNNFSQSGNTLNVVFSVPKDCSFWLCGGSLFSRICAFSFHKFCCRSCGSFPSNCPPSEEWDIEEKKLDLFNGR